MPVGSVLPCLGFGVLFGELEECGNRRPKSLEALIHVYWGVVGFTEWFPLLRIVPSSCRVCSA